MLFAITVGYVIGAPLAFFLTRWLLRALANRLGTNEPQRRWIKVVGGVVGALALAPAIFGGVLAAGYIERHRAGSISRFLDLNDVAVQYALCLGFAAEITLIVTITAAAGAWFGRLMARNLFPGNPN